MFEEIFCRKIFNREKAFSFGFQRKDSGYIYETSILDNQFWLQVTVSSFGEVDTKLTENETGEEYILYKTNSVGAYVGAIRQGVETVLVEVSEHCYDIEIFKSTQAKEIIRYVREKYGDELEFLWPKFPDNAVWRRKDTQKWYGAILTVAANKLGLASDKIVEIIDLRVSPEQMEALLAKGNYYPGWHMNKKTWYTIILDGSVTTDDICKRIDESYELALK